MSGAQRTFLYKVKQQQERFITGYFVAGDPSVESSIQIITESVRAGLDAIEIGFPSSNPYLEGDVIKRAHARTYSAFCQDEQYSIHFLETLRKEIDVPIWIMGYYADLIRTNFYKKLASSGCMDGFVIPDLNPEEGITLKAELTRNEISVIPVVNYRMPDAELKLAVKDTNIVYCQIYKGITGEEIKDLGSLPSFYRKIRNLTDAVLMAGFGVKNQELAKEVIKSGFDGVVVGSEIVSTVETNEIDKLMVFVKQLSKVKGGKVG
ncbi:tryptophan synthase subunit alpha [Peribacillus saganii]|uniref:tryptophan synthase n=1 Tax=Peribacillus saganii TaxID=2303992 RepID=A0A372LG96_9BACI|nr:tryptophan synthase subunit alpha [Peribacillus saganii]RFU64636.1 tryptophan synthase subunit alpha [Peribacillus saganii]